MKSLVFHLCLSYRSALGGLEAAFVADQKARREHEDRMFKLETDRLAAQREKDDKAYQLEVERIAAQRAKDALEAELRREELAIRRLEAENRRRELERLSSRLPS